MERPTIFRTTKLIRRFRKERLGRSADALYMGDALYVGDALPGRSLRETPYSFGRSPSCACRRCTSLIMLRTQMDGCVALPMQIKAPENNNVGCQKKGKISTINRFTIMASSVINNKH